MRSHAWLCASVTLLLLSGCGGGGESVAPPPTPAAIAVSGGNQQTGVAGGVLAQPVRVRVTSASGAGIGGVTVTFTAAANSGGVSVGAVATNADGFASTSWTLGTTAGVDLDTVRARVSALEGEAVFTASVTAAAAASLSPESGDGQTGRAGQSLAHPLVVVVRDQYGNPKSHVDVSWSVSSGGGSLTHTTSTSGFDGRGSVTWTPGTAGPNVAHATVVGLLGSPVSFAASLTPVASQLGAVSGNNQTGAPGQLLTQPLVVRLTTQTGAAVAGVNVAWAVTGGGGNLSQTTAPTNQEGRSSVLWTLGSAEGPQAITARVDGAAGSPVTFAATAVTPAGVVTLTAISPSPLVEGQTATLTGTGFSATPASNAVTIGDAAATVTAATPTSLTVSVPLFDCRPARDVPVQVRVGGEASGVITQALQPPSFTNVPVGQQLILQDPTAFCLQFAQSSSPEDYLIGVQSTSEQVSTLTSATLASSSSGTVPPLPSLARAALRTMRHVDKERRRLWQTHAKGEAETRRLEPRLSDAGSSRAQRLVSRVGPQPMNLKSGDLIELQVPNFLGGVPCSPIPITAEVRLIGTRGIWLVDMSNPIDGYTDQNLQALSDDFDGPVYSNDVLYFGEPTDLDGNGRIAVLVTKEVNRRGNSLGFVSTTDFRSQESCASSNEGEIFYAAAPDPAGQYELGPYPAARALADAPFLIAHELTHIIQVGRRAFVVGGPLMLPWTAEGQATLAEEVVGFAVEGRTSRQNLGYAIAANQDDPASIDWFSTRFDDIGDYYGFESSASKVAGAPGECSWLEGKPGNPGPCLGGRDIYGVPWSLLRWATDRYGPSFPGGEQGLQRALVNTTSIGYANLEDVLAVPIGTILAQWAAALYMDDRITGGAAELTVPSWNLHDIFEGNQVESARLVPSSKGFGNSSTAFRVRGGSTAYFRLSGASHEPTAVRIRTSTDNPLPAHMQVFLVRIR